MLNLGAGRRKMLGEVLGTPLLAITYSLADDAPTPQKVTHPATILIRRWNGHQRDAGECWI